ncbi:DUF2812 domain-containing protein [Clostridium sp. MCC353]|uniref:DUF2812 domain-containing protein n=1 Tax=Clostridium sp. MCC353 TaxID=2592646 RepID=UPI001C01F327|nr:DUF2812 domain-containing protein [Clostridium sp. MCC353]MBT9778020.1 DUF2812 domain-containing protein [Clostridium sp. MCC353]
MLNYKMSLWSFQADQLEAFAEYLEQQAKKGWFIDCKKADIIPFPVFRRRKPGNKRYSVVMIPNISQWDTDNDSRVVEYRQMCEEYGWEFVGSYRKFRIFSSENQDAVPIETDPKLWFENVGREQLTRTIPCYLVLLVLFVIQSRSFTRNPSWNLVNNNMVGSFAAQILAAVSMAFLAVKSTIWYVRTRSRLNAGRPLKKVSLKSVKVSSGIVMAAILLMIVTLFGTGGSVKKLILGGVMFAAVMVSMAVSGAIFRLVKKRGEGSDQENNFGYFVISFFSILLMIGMLNVVLFRVFPGGLIERDAVFEGETEFPFDPSAFGYEWDDSRYAKNDRSILASLQSGAYKKAGEDGEKGRVSISLYTARYDWVYHWLYEDMKDYYGNAYVVTGPEISRPCDLTVEYYKYEIPDAQTDKRFIYVVQKGSHILKLNFDKKDDKELVSHVLEQFEEWNG